MVSQVYPCKFLQIQIAFISGLSVYFVFKICQIVAGTSRIHQFHEFLEFNFWRAFYVWPKCAPTLTPYQIKFAVCIAQWVWRWFSWRKLPAILTSFFLSCVKKRGVFTIMCHPHPFYVPLHFRPCFYHLTVLPVALC